MKITITLDVIEEVGGRVFVVPSQEDIKYDTKIHQGKLREAENKLNRMLAEEESLLATQYAPGDSTDKKLREFAISIPATRELIERIKDMLEVLGQMEEKRQQLLPLCKQVSLDFTEPEWGDVAQNEERFKKLIEATGTYVVDYASAYNALLRKCCPGVATQPVAVAERMMLILRRYTEVNMSDLPFLL